MPEGALVSALRSDDNPAVRREALPALEAALSDAEPLVSRHAAWAIQRIREAKNP